MVYNSLMEKLILAVDDEAKILEIVKSYLEMNGYRCLCAGTGKEALALFEKNPVDLILLDLMLPDIPGGEICRRVREVSDIPIIMVTAKIDEEDIIRGLNMGAEDYVTKPFSPRQLAARVTAALRRGGRAAAAGKCITAGGLRLDTEERRVSRNGEALSLTKDEYSILELLMSRPAKIFTRDEIIESIKGENYDGFDRSIDTHIKNLRQKLGDDPRAPRYILTVYGMGYRLSAQEE
jgi:DNA-binding response OmpR family regulator